MAGFADAVEITLLCVACRRWRCIAVFRGFAFYFISCKARAVSPPFSLWEYSTLSDLPGVLPVAPG